MSEQKRRAVETLDGLLKHARLRWTVLMLASVAGLLAVFATPEPKEIPAKQRTLLEHVQFLEDHEIARKLFSQAFRDWLSTDKVIAIKKAEIAIRNAGETLSQAGVNARVLIFFTTGPAFSNYAYSVRQLKENPLPKNLNTWSVGEIDAVAEVVGGFRAERVRSFGREMAEAKRLLDTMAPNPSLADPAASALAALNLIGQELPKLLTPYESVPESTAATLSEIASALSGDGFDSLADPLNVISVTVVASAFDAVSITVFGLTIPGFALPLLLPLFVFGLALDVGATLKKTVNWAKASVPVAEVRAYVNFFPWIPILILARVNRKTAFNLVISVIACAVHLAPAAMLFPLSAARLEFSVVWIVSILCLIGIAIAQCYTLKLLFDLNSCGTNKAGFGSNLDDQTGKLVASNFEWIENAWSATIVVSAVVSTFIVVYLFIPPSLLQDRTILKRAHATREALQIAYDQRFQMNRDTFKAWCDATCDTYASWIFLSQNFPEDHPAYRLVEAAQKEEPIRSYPKALMNIKDFVLESRARLVELDRDNLKDVIEILYRQDLDPLPDRLRAIARALAQQPLDAEIMKGVSPLVRNVATLGPLQPLPVTYRQNIEIGDFAKILTKLPERSAVRDLVSFMQERGFKNLSGFDAYQAPFNRLYGAFDNATLKIAGVEIGPLLARFVAAWFITPLLALLLLRLIVAKKAVQHLNDKTSTSTLLRATTSSFLHFEPDPRPAMTWLRGAVRMALPILVLGLIVWTASDPAGGFDWAAAGAILGLVLIVLIAFERRQLLSIPNS